MEDRFGELLQFGKGNPFLDEPAAEEPEPFMDEFFAKVEQIRGQIKQMRGGVIELKQDYTAALDQVDTRRKKKSSQEIDAAVQRTNSLASKIREDLKLVASALPPESNDGLATHERIMKNSHKSLTKEFLDLMQEYQTIQKNYNEKSRDIVKAQVILVNPSATEQDVERAIELGPDQVFAMDRRKAAMESYNYIQNRHDEILKIERSLEEVHQMFVDMAVLVEEQSEVIDRIAFQVQNVKKDVRAATEELREANKIQRQKCSIQ
jgi:t-SNARE complex subunit (syntaxin)